MVPPPNGTMYVPASTKSIHESDYPEFFNLPLKRCNEMLVSVKGTQGAEIALYNTKFDTSTTKPIIITLGAEKNTKSTISVHGDAKEKAHADKKGLLSPNVHMSYRIEWNRNLIRVMNESDDACDSFLWYKSATLVEIDMFGIRSVGSNASWYCQGAKNVTTTDGQDFQHFEVATGKLWFDIKAKQDVHLAISRTQKAEAPMWSFLIGSPSSTHITMYHDGKEVGQGDLGKGIGDDDFLSIWVKWDAGSMAIGKLKFDPASVTHLAPVGAPFQRMNFFAFNSANTASSFWKIQVSYDKDEYDNFCSSNGAQSPKIKADWEK